MKIQKEDFNKLKQLDRIEYLLKKEKLEKYKDSKLIDGNYFVNICLILSGYFTIIFLELSNLIGIEESLNFLALSVKLLFAGIAIFVIIFTYNLLIRKTLLKKLDDELESEYFTIKQRRIN